MSSLTIASDRVVGSKYPQFCLKVPQNNFKYVPSKTQYDPSKT
jgi:hypothetical protein